MTAPLTEAELKRLASDGEAIAKRLIIYGSREGRGEAAATWIRAALPYLDTTLSSLAALKRERDELRADFEEYANHNPSCPLPNVTGNKRPCDCGLDAVRARHADDKRIQ